ADGVVAEWIRALAGSCARTWNIKRGEHAVLSEREAVKHTARVNVLSSERPRRVDVCGRCALAGACASAWNVERGDRSVRGTQVAMIQDGRVNVCVCNR